MQPNSHLVKLLLILFLDILGNLLDTSLIFAKSDPAVTSRPKRTTSLENKGESSFNVHCSPCHGLELDGMGPNGPALLPKTKHLLKGTMFKASKPEDLFKAITEKGPTTHGSGFSRLPEEEKWAIVYFLLTKSLLP